MNIDVTDFSAIQRQALFDLLILALYQDGHQTTVEDPLLQQLLTAMGHTDDSDRQRELDGAVSRVRPFLQSIAKAKAQAVLLASAFTVRSQQKKVYAAVQQIMRTDKHVSSWESTLLSELRLVFRL
jgi:nicotinamide mononucleotide adenylyltransferase